jgi:putative cardiolipin synthase
MVTMKRLLRLFGLVALLLTALVLSGLLLADHLTPRATGEPSRMLPLQVDQSEIDRELAPMLAAHPGESGVLMLSDGLDAFAARAIAARRAGRSLDLQYYIWHDDLTGHLLAREVYFAAERGVRVRLLLDDMNAEGLDPKLMALDAHPNIELRLYNPFRNRAGIARLFEMVQRIFSVNHRMHNKAWIADGRVAVVGGRNIGEEYFGADPDVNFRDLDLFLFGPVVEDAGAIFDDYWNSAAAVPIAALNESSIDELRAIISRYTDEAMAATALPYLARVERSRTVQDYHARGLTPRWTSRVAVVADPPLKGREDERSGWLIHHLVAVLEGAREEALLISPYFVPGEAGSAALEHLVARGARVAIATNSLAANDVPAVHSGYARYRERLLRAGVRLHELKARVQVETAGAFGSSGASLHTKAFVVDGARGFVGSFNLDPRSVDLNTEMGVLFDDPVIAAGLREEFAKLARPESSYDVELGEEGDLRWIDRSADPPLLLDREPDTTWTRRLVVRLIGLLPIESQL